MSKLEEWLESIDCEGALEPVSEDASFRKYFRLKSMMHSGVVMDASLQKESLEPFIELNHRLYEAGVRVPKINTYNKKEGFLFMEDLGDTHLYEKIDSGESDFFYEKALDTLVKMQNTETEGLSLYDEAFLKFEMELMPEWYLEKYLDLNLSEEQREILKHTFDTVITEVKAQPQGIFVHRDYHSRNIMVGGCADEIVVIDYQDARSGAVTYDLVSLLRDVYVELDSKEVERMALSFRDKKGLNVDNETFMRWFDFTGLQRHIKILGIFARLNLRDGKEGYLSHIPLTLKYVEHVANKYEELADFAQLLKFLNEKE